MPTTSGPVSSPDEAPATPTLTPTPTVSAVHAPARETLAFEAVDAVLRGRLLVAIEPGSRAVRALDLDSGDELWRIALGQETPASVIHDLGHGRLLVQVPGQEFHTIDLASGTHIAHRPSPAGWRFVARRGGACALSSRCTLEPISCEDGRALGPGLLGATVTFAPMGPEDDSGPTCATSLEVLGRAGELSLYVTRVEGEEHTQVIARDDAGATRWRSSAVACESCQVVGVGSAPDGSVCWTTDGLERERTLRAFRCADGSPLFERHFQAAPGYRHPPIVTGWVDDPAGLFVGTDDRVMLLAADGTSLWERPGASDALVLPTGLRVPSYPLALDRYARVEDADPHTGRTQQTRALYRGAELRIDEQGAVGILPPGQIYERGGAPVPALRVFSFARARTGSHASVYGHLALELPGDAHVVGERTTASGSRLVVAEERPGQPDRVHVLAVDARRCEPSCCAQQVRTPGPEGTVECCFCD